MRSLYYLMAAVLVTMLAVAVVFIWSSVPRPRRMEAQFAREVFVDLSRLERLLPASRTVAGMSDALAKAQRSSHSTVTVSFSSLKALDLGNVGPGSDGRQELEGEMAQTAVSALTQLESEQRQSLVKRIEAMRAALNVNMRSEIDAQVSEIRNQEYSKIRALAERLSWVRINADMKADSLTVALGSEGVQKDRTKPLLAEATAEVNRITNDLSVEKGVIEHNAQASIDGLVKAASDKIAASLSSYESEEQNRIENTIGQARNQILREMSSFDSLATSTSQMVLHGDSANIPKVRRSLVIVTKTDGSNSDTRKVGKALISIKTRIRGEAKRMVLALAAERNVRVTFSRRENTPDATARFVNLILRHNFLERPVIAGSYGS